MAEETSIKTNQITYAQTVKNKIPVMPDQIKKSHL